jgi:hypothetical protein
MSILFEPVGHYSNVCFERGIGAIDVFIEGKSTSSFFLNHVSVVAALFYFTVITDF